jgi:cytochrome c oxidase assembly protein subunit 15
MQTPLGYFASKYELGPRSLRWATTTALVVSIIIVFTGGVVRVTGSGLGCPTWPTCDGSSIAPSAELGIHGIIEFANRLLTGVIVIAVGWVIVAARLQRPRVRFITRLAWSQFWLVVANAIAGGITVLVQLNPWVVALHFLLAIALLATTTLTWHRVRENSTVHEADSLAWTGVSRSVSRLSWALAAVTLLLVSVGTLVSGTGPHSGDSAEVPRMPLNWTSVTIVHAVLAIAVIALGVVILVALRSPRSDGGAPPRVPGGREALVRKRTIVFLIIAAAQSLTGTVQALSGLPASLVSFHLLGAALVWVGALRILLDANPTLFARERIRDSASIST